MTGERQLSLKHMIPLREKYSCSSIAVTRRISFSPRLWGFSSKGSFNSSNRDSFIRRSGRM